MDWIGRKPIYFRNKNEEKMVEKPKKAKRKPRPLPEMMGADGKMKKITFRDVLDARLSLPFMTSDREAEALPGTDDFHYINYNSVEFPLLIDADEIIFAGLIGEEPTYAEFTINNPMNCNFHYKVKSSSNAHFRVLRPVGMIRRHTSITLSVMALPVLPIPKPFTHYLHVHVKMAFPGEDTTPLAVWRGPIKTRSFKQRLYADFFYHPNIDRARAALLASNVMARKGHAHNFKIANETHRIRQGCIDLLMKKMERHAIRGEMESQTDFSERMIHIAALANDQHKMRRFMENLHEGVDIGELLWPKRSKVNAMDLTEKMKAKGVNEMVNFDEGVNADPLKKLTPQEEVEANKKAEERRQRFREHRRKMFLKRAELDMPSILQRKSLSPLRRAK